MTLGTNATLEERLKYAPDEITPDEIAKVLDELAAWKELLSDEFDGPDDIKARLEELEEEVTLKDSEIGGLEDDIARKARDIEELEDDIARKDRDIKELEDDIARKDRDIEDLEAEVDELSQEINYLNNRNAELEDQLKEHP